MLSTYCFLPKQSLRPLRLCGKRYIELSNDHQALFWERLDERTVSCLLCPRGCKLKEGEAGYCGARKAEGGNLVSLVYGKVGAMMVSAIEKKPMYHFHPGSRWLSIGTFGCNFRCHGCQNFDLAHADPERAGGRYIPPESLVRIAIDEDSAGLSFTYNEPTIWLEYVIDCARLARDGGLLLNLVTNGFISEHARDEIFNLIDAYRVDVKGYFPETYQEIASHEQAEVIRDNIKRAKELGIWVELVTNLIPRVNDSEDELEALASWIKDEVGEETPWHLTRFFPAYKWSHIPPTPVEKMMDAQKLAKDIGLKFVYLGNLHGHASENTFCPDCGALLIERRIYGVLEMKLGADGLCPNCGRKIPGHFEKARKGICFDEIV
jgi:pyruvate formate lyase activating enzyme